MQRVAGPVDDGLEQLVPGARGGGQAQDLVEEAQLVELVPAARRRARTRLEGFGSAGGISSGALSGGRHGHHGTSLGKVGPSKGCGRGKVAKRYGPQGMGRMSAAPRRAPSAAVRAEPTGIGTSGAPDTLSAEVRLMGALLGQVVSEQAGPELFELVERVRRRAIALRQDDDPDERRRLDEDLAGLDLGSAEAVVGAFALYFQLVNLVEARGRVRALRRRERAARDGALDDSVAEAVASLRRAGRSEAELDALLERLSVTLVLTAHPTEARRRTTLGRPSTLRGAARAARRPAPDPVGGPRRPPPDARGDHAPVADRGPSRGGAHAARRGAHGDGVLRRDAVHGRDPAVPGTRRGIRPAGVPAWRRRRDRFGAHRDSRAAGRAVPALGQLDRRRSRRQPGRHRRHQRAHDAHPGRARPPRLRGGRDPAHADGRRGLVARARHAAPGVAHRARRRDAPRGRPTGPPTVSRRAVSTAVRVHRRAPAPDAGRADRRACRADRSISHARRARRGAARTPGGAAR